MKKPESFRDTLVQLLATRPPSLPLIALVGDVIAADARFNLWIGLEGKGTLSEDALMQTGERYEKAVNECRAEVHSYVPGQETRSLEEVLSRTLEFLRKRPDL